MAGHGPGVPEAEIDIPMPVNIEKVSTLRLAHERRECPRPLDHPVHGHACQQRLARTLEQRLRFWALVHKLLLFALHEELQTAAIDTLHRSESEGER